MVVKATQARRCLAVALGVLGWVTALGVPAIAGAAPAPGPTPAAEGPDEAAKRVAVARAREAARAGDFAAALAHYEEALRLRPSAKLHFNIAVCHHRLMMGHATGSPAYEEQRAAAVGAYNRYLEAAPGAADTDEVAELIRALGGTPLVDDPEPWTIELVEPDAVPDPPRLDDSGGTTTTPTTTTPAVTTTTPTITEPRATPPTGPTPPSLRGRLGVFVPLVLGNPARLAASDELRPLPALGLGVRGNAFLGPQRRIALGGELGLGTQPASAASRHRRSRGWLGVLLEARHSLGRGRFEVGGGGVVGLGWQSLVYTGPSPLRCAAAGREASRRAGLWAGTRLQLAALLGKRRNHELSLRLGPGLMAMAEGSVASEDADGMTCDTEPSAFAAFGLPDGAALSVTVDIGYAPRF